MAEQGSPRHDGRKGGSLYQLASSFLSVIPSGSPACGVYACLPCLVTSLQTPSQTHPEVCFTALDTSQSNQIDSQD